VSRDAEKRDRNRRRDKYAICQWERVYVEMHNVSENMMCAAQEHLGRGEPARGECGQLAIRIETGINMDQRDA